MEINLQEKKIIKIYTDGSAAPNPGPGGYGVALVNEQNKVLAIFNEQCDYTTNNREELKALLVGLKISQRLSQLNIESIIYLDSAYCYNIYNTWMHSWILNDWKKKDNKEIENIDLIQDIYNIFYNNFTAPTIEKIKGHNGIFGNELADALATSNQNKIKELAPQMPLTSLKNFVKI